MPKFRKKPVDVEASIVNNLMRISTPEGRLIAKPGSVLITGISGEHYPCQRDIFLKSYEPAEGDNAARVMFDVLTKMEEAHASQDNEDNTRLEEGEVPRLNSGRSEGESHE